MSGSKLRQAVSTRADMVFVTKSDLCKLEDFLSKDLLDENFFLETNTLKDKPSSKIMASSHKTWPKTSPCFRVREQSLMSMPEPAKLIIKLGDQERQSCREENTASDIDVRGSRARGSADLRQGLPHDTAFISPDLYNHSSPILHASSAPPIRVCRHTHFASRAFVPSKLLRDWDETLTASGTKSVTAAQVSARFQHIQSSGTNGGSNAKVATPKVTAAAETGAFAETGAALAVAAAAGRFGSHVQKPLDIFVPRETSYTSQNSARVKVGAVGPLLTEDQRREHSYSSQNSARAMVGSLLTEDQRREQLQSLMARMRRPEANLDVCDRKRPFHHAYNG